MPSHKEIVARYRRTAIQLPNYRDLGNNLLPKLKARKHLENKTKTRCVYSARRRDPGKRAVARTPPLAAPPPRVDRPRLPCRPHAYLSTEGYVNHVDRARPPPHPHTTNVPRPPHPRPRASQRVTAPAEGRWFTRGTRPRAPDRFRLVDAPRRRHASRGHVPAMGARHVGRIGRLRRCHTTVRGPARRPRGAWHPCSCLLYPPRHHLERKRNPSRSQASKSH